MGSMAAPMGSSIAPMGSLAAQRRQRCCAPREDSGPKPTQRQGSRCDSGALKWLRIEYFTGSRDCGSCCTHEQRRFIPAF